MSLTRVAHTVEGDPVTHTITVLAADRVEVRLDSRDSYGLRGVFTTTCRTLRRGQSELGFPLRFEGCTGDDRALPML